MRASRSLCAFGMCCLLLGGCADTAAEGVQTYIVRPQDTLYSIAWRHDLDYRDLARWNYLGADFRISVGQVLFLGPGRAPPAEAAPPRAAPPRAVPAPEASGAAGPPGPEAPRVSKPRPLPAPPSLSPGAPLPATAPPPTGAPRQASAAPQASAPPQAGAAPPATAPMRSIAPSTAAAPPSVSTPVDAAPSFGNGALKWVWPTDRSSAPHPVPGGGILLSGRLGQDVRAASAGRVVYTGNGMRSYGNLIIIKHADSLLSAYAHNREMLVHEGQEVATGQVIAHMGEGGPQTPVLYFEIRQNGRPVDPLPFLPKTK